MSVSITNKHSDHVSMTFGQWGKILQTAHENGWEPLGLISSMYAPGEDEEEEDGIPLDGRYTHFRYSAGTSLMTTEDANAIVDALMRADANSHEPNHEQSDHSWAIENIFRQAPIRIN